MFKIGESLIQKRCEIKLTDYIENIYPYHLHFYGQIENNGLATRLFKTGARDFWFENQELLDEATEYIKSVAKQHNVIVVVQKHSGENAQKRTVAYMDFLYEGESYGYRYDFGYGYPADSAEYMFMDGNYACDCNRSAFIRETHDENFPDLDCGDEIKVTNFRVELERGEI